MPFWLPLLCGQQLQQEPRQLGHYALAEVWDAGLPARSLLCESFPFFALFCFAWVCCVHGEGEAESEPLISCSESTVLRVHLRLRVKHGSLLLVLSCSVLPYVSLASGEVRRVMVAKEKMRRGLRAASEDEKQGRLALFVAFFFLRSSSDTLTRQRPRRYVCGGDDDR